MTALIRTANPHLDMLDTSISLSIVEMMEPDTEVGAEEEGGEMEMEV